MHRFVLIGCIAVLLSVTAPLWAESLYPADSAKPMYADKKAFKVGDVVTVTIEESAVSSSTASTDTQKDSSVEAGPGVGSVLSKIPLMQYSGGDSIKAKGTTTRSSKFVAKMTAKVTKIDANGNLEIEGTKTVQTNKEKEEIKLTGTARPQDIAPDNTISSTSLANACITHQGNGPIGSRQKEGIISKVLKILF